MEKAYNPQQIEQRWYQHWEQAGYFKPTGHGESYCIMLPPPNVTGTLHMGHGFQISLMDALIRYHRMRGYNTLWQAGTDHAGIATQMVVERQLAQEGRSRAQLGREAFEERIWEWKHQSDGIIKQQLREMGCSMDWDRERFTMDHQICDAVHEVFVSLYEKGLIYRGKTLVNWDPALQTAVSDLEVVNQEQQGQIWHIRYPIVDSDETLTVATTRPETMLGDSAVAVHPEDERYQHLIGKFVELPLTERTIPIIADDYVDREFGTGCVKITPAHDFNDYDVGKRHDLAMINILTPDARINEHAPTAYQGLDRFDARKQIIHDLTEQGLLVKTEKHQNKIPLGDRSGAVLEPYLTNQWFVKAKPLAERALEVVKQGKIKFIPENWTKIYYQWLEDIHDWCISRHLWWGHRIPAWYDETGNVYVGHNEADARKRNQLSPEVTLTQEEDVLDTWFSSALWPFATLGWPQPTDDFKTFYPTSVLVTGFDIIFFWVARMVMMGLKFTDDIPFKHVYITGLIRDSEGQKMSKSKGNILDPLDLVHGVDLETLINKRTRGLMQPQMAAKIEKATRKEFPDGIQAYGTDALRFTYCALATTGRDIRFDLGRIEGYRNFCNKIWNASRFVFMNLEKHSLDLTGEHELSAADRWINDRLQHTIQAVHDNFANYRFDLIAQTIYEFIWNDYCDWYLELSKTILYSETASKQAVRGTLITLVNVLETFLRLLHPMMPFITEEIWQRVNELQPQAVKSIMLTAYPEPSEHQHDIEIANKIETIKKIITAIRNIRAEMNIAPNKPIDVLFAKGTTADRTLLTDYQDYLITLTKIKSIEFHPESTPYPAAATAIVGELEILIPMAGLIDKDAEISRLNKELSKLDKDLARSSQKLANPNYVDKAPTAVVDQERERLKEMQNIQQKLQQQLKVIEMI